MSATDLSEGAWGADHERFISDASPKTMEVKGESSKSKDSVRDVSSDEVQRVRKEVKERRLVKIKKKKTVLMMETINIILLLMVSVISVNINETKRYGKVRLDSKQTSGYFMPSRDTGLTVWWME